MRDIKRIDLIIEQLRLLWHNHPDERLGQLVANVMENHAPKPIHNSDYRYFLRIIEDDMWSRMISEYTKVTK